MSGQRQKIQLTLAFPEEERGEASRASGDRVEPCVVSDDTQDPVKLDSLMEAVLERTNLKRALHKIQSNRGSRTPGVDGMPVRKLAAYLRKHWPKIKADLESGSYQPFPVKHVEIPKSGGPHGGFIRRGSFRSAERSKHEGKRHNRPPSAVRKLGISTALDRFMQQAVLQVLQPIFDPTFSDGHRPKVGRLRLPSRTECSSGGDQSSELSERRLSLGRGPPRADCSARQRMVVRR